MKLTKSHLRRLIKEELAQGFGQGAHGKDEFSKKREVFLEDEGVQSKMQLQKKFRELYNGIVSVKGLDAREIELFDKLITIALQQMQAGNALTPLTYAIQKLTTGEEEEVQAPEAAPPEQ